MEDLKPELVMKLAGKVKVYFNELWEAEKFLAEHSFPFLTGRIDEAECCIYFTQSESDSAVQKNQLYVCKKVVDFRSTLSRAGIHATGWMVVMGDRGFIIKYEPCNDGISLFKSASINALLLVPVDDLSQILTDYVYNARK